MKRAIAVSILFFAASASAQGDRQAARAAYEAGTQAFHRGDFATAATRYAEADALAPSPVALQAALDAAVKADDAVLGAELLERAQSRAPTPQLAASVRAAQTKLAHRASKVTATCPSACTITLDGSELEKDHAKWVAPGGHEIVFTIDGRTETKPITVAPDASVTVEPAPPPPTPPPPPPGHPLPPPPEAPVVVAPPPPPAFVEPAPKKHRRGLSPAVFWASLGVTGAFGIASGVLLGVTAATHGTFVDQSCSSTDTASCRSLASLGKATMYTGDAFLGVSIAAAVWTVIAGALVRWHPSVEVEPQAHGATVFWRVTF